MNFNQARVRLVQAGTVLAAAALVAGCGNNYRPVVTPVNNTPPPAQPQSYVVVVSAPSVTSAGIATIIDYSGDTVMAQADIGPGPTTFTVDANGQNGYTYNSDHTITNFPVSTSLLKKNVYYTTLPSNAKPLNLFSPASGLWAADLCALTPTTRPCDSAVDSGVDIFTGSPETFLRPVPVATIPVMVVGIGGAQRYFAISQNIATPTGVECNASPAAVTVNGAVTGIEISSDEADQPIAVGICPVYAVESSDTRRLFVLNRGSDTITVIDAQKGTLDGQFDANGACVPFKSQTGQTVTCHETLPLSTTALKATGVTPPNCNLTTDPTCGGMTAVAGPVYAEYNALTNQLVVANYDGGTVSVIDVTLDEYGNDSPSFGTTYTIPVGKNPASLTVLVDGSRAYTANQTDQTVSIVNLTSHVQEKLPLAVVGHPRTVVSTQNSTEGKVYVASPDSPYLTVISTGGLDPDVVDTTVLVQGNIVDVRVSSQNAVSGNINTVSRIPGYGQPCNLPGATVANSLATCQQLPLP
jgi:DNA-binding beta-propeller fold protein YncE